MKHLFFLIALLTINIAIIGQEITGKSTINSVTVFRQGVQINRSATVKLKSGLNQVVITDLPAGFNDQSISVRSLSRLEISAVQYRTDYTQDYESSPAYLELKNKLETTFRLKEDETVVLNSLKDEENMILANKNITGTNTGLTAEQLVKMSDFYRTRLPELKNKILASTRKITDIDKEITRLQKQMNEISSKNNQQYKGEIVILVESKKTMDELIEFSYIDPRASWVTSYDLRLESLQKPLNLQYKGKVRQTTGEDWKDVQLALATGNPQFNMQFPVINPWFLYYTAPLFGYEAGAPMMLDEVVQVRGSINVRAEKEEAAGEVTVAKENVTFMEFSLPGKYAIPSDGKEHEFKVQDNTLPGFYRYIAVPKLDNKVYLVANVEDWSKYNLASGNMKLFFESTFIGNNYFDANIVTDTLSISLGPDIAISTTREKLKDLKKTRFLSNKKQIQSGWEITIRNNKTVEAEILLQDQIPLSTDGEMTVEADELSGGKLNKETGVVEWNLKLKPGESVKKVIAYTIKIPKDKQVVLN
ncbi:MAG TPA: DUF4139 domain-containing protein [Saprospiraceae bacterium]|nr:DUF4139 domain-containing protein [Saprospiraceae bacterium]